MTNPPEDMRAELASWNDGKGVSLETWVSCMGNSRLAIGYSAVFWPKLILFEDYILRDGFTEEAVRTWEQKCAGDKGGLEAVCNHVHIADLQAYGCEDLTEPRIVHLGRVLKEMLEAKLAWQFPDRPCEVDFYEPEDRTDLMAFQVTFWQRKHGVERSEFAG